MANSYDNFKPQYKSGGDHKKYIQDAMDAIVDQGKPAKLDMGGFLWEVDGTLTPDCGLITEMDMSGGARIEFDNPTSKIAVGLHVQQQVRPVNYDAHMNSIAGADGKGAGIFVSNQFKIRQARIYGNPDNVDLAVYCHQEEGPNGFFSSAILEDCIISGFQHHLVLGDNAFMVSVRGGMLNAATDASYVKGYDPANPTQPKWYVNSGESTTFESVVIANSGQPFRSLTGANADDYFNKCRIDYPSHAGIDLMSGGNFVFEGCHIEMRAMRDGASQPVPPLRIDNGSYARFVDCNMSDMPTDIPLPDNMIWMYGGKGYVDLVRCYEGYGWQMGEVNADGTPKICNEPDHVRIERSYPSGGQAGYSSMKGRMNWNVGTPGWS